MNRLWPKRLTLEMVVRIIADAVMVNAALLSSLILRYLWSVGVEGQGVSTGASFGDYMGAYLSTFWFLTPICLIVFYRSGFYTHGRAYRGRYKALVITQAVTSSYLILGFLALLLRDVIAFPRSVLFMAWFLTLVFLIGARLWAMLWSTFVEAERRLVLPDSKGNKTPKVLIIGGVGYIGSALVQRLLELGYKVRVLDCLLYGDASISEFYKHANFELIQGDLRHIHTVVSAAKDVDAIVHLGAIVGDSACSIDQDLTVEINLRATRTIAEIGKGFGVKRFIFASTCSVYGASDEILDERSALNPISLYARTKIESEKVLLSLTDDTFAPTILRFGTVYGLSGRPRFDLVVNLLAAKAVQDGEVVITGGVQWRPLVHVKDVAEAIVLALQAPFYSVRGQIFNVGCNEQNYQIADLGRIIGEMVPAARVVTQPTEDNRNYRVRFDKIYKVLNFQPRRTVRDGMREVMDAFATGKITDYRDPRYSNFSFLKRQGGLKRVFVEDEVGLELGTLSAQETKMLADVLIAMAGYRSWELMARLRDGLVQASLGDINGFRKVLQDIEAAGVLQRLPETSPRRTPRMPVATRPGNLLRQGLAGFRAWLGRSLVPKPVPLRLARVAVSLPIVLSLILAGGGVTVAAAQSQPSDPLYGVKLALEQVQLATSLTDTARADTYLRLADTRLRETAQMAQAGRADLVSGLVGEYEQDLENGLTLAQQAQVQGQDVSSLLTRFQECLHSHETLLEATREQVPTPDQPAIDQAVIVSQRGHAQVLTLSGGTSIVPAAAPMASVTAIAALPTTPASYTALLPTATPVPPTAVSTTVVRPPLPIHTPSPMLTPQPPVLMPQPSVQIAWALPDVSAIVAPGASYVANVSFSSATPLSNVSLVVMSPFVRCFSVSPASLATVAAGTDNPVQVTIAVPVGTKPGLVTGMVLLHVDGRPVAPGLKISLTVAQPSMTAVAPPTPTAVGATPSTTPGAKPSIVPKLTIVPKPTIVPEPPIAP
jgi:nucleoside-diphosphate-sugar epimerase